MPPPRPPLLTRLTPPTTGCPAVFVCYALDRDSATISQPAVYAVFAAVPLPGAVVEQPDGGMAYGAGQRAAPEGGPHLYQPPAVAQV